MNKNPYVYSFRFSWRDSFKACSSNYGSVWSIWFRNPINQTNVYLWKSDLLDALKEAKELEAIVLQTLISEELVKISNEYCQKHNLFTIDALSPLVNEVNRRTDIEPSRVPGALHFLNENYFERINAMEFAVKYDDGKDPRGFLEADILLLGVSRTSKTPLSLFLANKNLKVANLPLIPEAHIPPQIWEVDLKKLSV